MKKISLLALFLFLFSAISFAHGPVRGKMTAKVAIDAPAEEVWDVIKNFDDMSWHPGIKSTDGKGGNEKGATRVLTLPGGGTITEFLKKYDDKKMSYTYKITDMSIVKTIQHSGQDEDVPVLAVDNYQGKLTVKKKGSGSEVIWVATYYRGYMNNNPPVELNEETADKQVTAVLKEGLTSLLNKFEPAASPETITFEMKR
ncbi:mxaD protein [Bathymodiolus japonicus methanotrophic gill symbiont]|uniref:SRPBCC family protein n=1 Tax=Bathymodiolus japonicus methanotrophic gill symbiont TaxID=113269 RepID=UPI001B5BBDF6|nr:SRPBCC family protein [Bathymodiolus japonicus methanotrophic gill symbiont]GFO72214.1 mxaD protein [Bathymodiolus japonicus methanotrophic gill symbiont]